MSHPRADKICDMNEEYPYLTKVDSSWCELEVDWDGKGDWMSLEAFWGSRKDQWFAHRVIKPGRVRRISEQHVYNIDSQDFGRMFRAIIVHDQLWRHPCSDLLAENYRLQHRDAAFSLARSAAYSILSSADELVPWGQNDEVEIRKRPNVDRLRKSFVGWQQVFILLALRHSDHLADKFFALSLCRTLLGIEDAESNSFIQNTDEVPADADLLRFMRRAVLEVHKAKGQTQYEIFDGLLYKDHETSDFTRFGKILDSKSGMRPAAPLKQSPVSKDKSIRISKSANALCYGNSTITECDIRAAVLELAPRDGKIAISISGGLDSIVLSHLAAELCYWNDWSLILIHINYNNRKEVETEVEFLKQWSSFIGATLIVRKIDEIRRVRSTKIRAVYEEVTRIIRFDAYKNFGDSVFLGHNRDDALENIFSNVAREIHYSDLRGMAERGRESGVDLLRPFLSTSKSHLYGYASTKKLPYLEDSTPSWSNRGRCRDIIMPALHSHHSQLLEGVGALAERMRILELREKKALEEFLETQIKESKKEGTLRVSFPKSRFARERFAELPFWISLWFRFNFNGRPSNKSFKDLGRRLLNPTEKQQKQLDHGRKEAFQIPLSNGCWAEVEPEIVSLVQIGHHK